MTGNPLNPEEHAYMKTPWVTLHVDYRIKYLWTSDHHTHVRAFIKLLPLIKSIQMDKITPTPTHLYSGGNLSFGDLVCKQLMKTSAKALNQIQQSDLFLLTYLLILTDSINDSLWSGSQWRWCHQFILEWLYNNPLGDFGRRRTLENPKEVHMGTGKKHKNHHSALSFN